MGFRARACGDSCQSRRDLASSLWHVDFSSRASHTGPVKFLIALLILAAGITAAPAGEPVTLYARVQDPLVVKLSDGTVWEMEKGDCFPVIAYKESHTKLILRLARNSFIVPAKSAVVVPDKEVPAAAEKYRMTVNSYLENVTSQWRKKAEAAKPK
jgi:hypothetical protein